MSKEVYFCTSCRRKYNLEPKENTVFKCSHCKVVMAPIPVAPGYLGRRNETYTYELKEIIAGRIFVDVPVLTNPGTKTPEGKRIGQVRNATILAREAAIKCSAIANGADPKSKELLGRWFHNRKHQDSPQTHPRPDLTRRVREVLLNVTQALEFRQITFALATPVNLWAMQDPNSPAFAWPPEFNQIVGKNEAAKASKNERDFQQAVAGLPSFGTGSGIRIVLTEQFFANGPVVQASTIIHELTHKTSNTLDLCYGAWQCHDLAIFEPYKAVENADNYTCFAEQAMGQTEKQIFTWDGKFNPPNSGYSAEGY